MLQDLLLCNRDFFLIYIRCMVISAKKILSRLLFIMCSIPETEFINTSGIQKEMYHNLSCCNNVIMTQNRKSVLQSCTHFYKLHFLWCCIRHWPRSSIIAHTNLLFKANDIIDVALHRVIRNYISFHLWNIHDIQKRFNWKL